MSTSVCRRVCVPTSASTPHPPTSHTRTPAASSASSTRSTSAGPTLTFARSATRRITGDSSHLVGTTRRRTRPTTAVALPYHVLISAPARAGRASRTWCLLAGPRAVVRHDLGRVERGRVERHLVDRVLAALIAAADDERGGA